MIVFLCLPQLSPLIQDTVLKGTFNHTLNNPVMPAADAPHALSSAKHAFLLGVWGFGSSQIKAVEFTPRNVGLKAFLLPLVFSLNSPAEVFSLTRSNLWLPVSVNYQYNLFFSFSIIHCPRLSPCLANRFSLMCLSLIRLRFRFSPFFWTGFCFNLATFFSSVNSTVPFHWKEGGIVDFVFFLNKEFHLQIL